MSHWKNAWSRGADRLREREDRLEQSENEIADLQQLLREEEQRTEACEARLRVYDAQELVWDAYRRSRGWALLHAAWRVRLWLIPSQSRRETLVKTPFRIARSMYRGVQRAVSGLRLAVRWSGSQIKAAGEMAAWAVAKACFLVLRFVFRRLPAAYRNRIKTAVYGQLAPQLASPINAPPTGQGGNRPAREAQSMTIPYTGVRAPHGRRRVAVLTNQLLDWEDRRPRYGGGERYAVTLANLMRELGLEVTFFQPTHRPFRANTSDSPL